MSIHDRPMHVVVRDRDFMGWMIEERRRTGADKFDEVWEGVYHMSPLAGKMHQRIVMWLSAFLFQVAGGHGLGEVFPGMNVRAPGSGTRNYRCPDIVFVSKARAAILSEFGCEGGPDLVVEVRSPGDESYEKKDFYAGQGVLEMLVVDVETRRVDLFRRTGEDLAAVPPAADGSIALETLPVSLATAVREGKPILAARDLSDPARTLEV